MVQQRELLITGTFRYANTQKSLSVDVDYKAGITGPTQGLISGGFSKNTIKNELINNSQIAVRDLIGSASFHNKQIVKFGLRAETRGEGIQFESQVVLGFNKTKLFTIDVSGDVSKDLSGSKGSFSMGSLFGAKGTYIVNKGFGYKIDTTIWGPVSLSPSTKNDGKMADPSSAKIGAIGIGLSRLQLTNKSSAYFAVGISTISINHKRSAYFGVRYSWKF